MRALARALSVGVAAAACSASSALAQEPAPIEAGVAPPPGEYAPGVDALHYAIEIGVSDVHDWVEGITTVRALVEQADATLPLDFTGLEVQDVSLVRPARGRAAYDYERGVLSVPLVGSRPGDTVEVRVAYRGVPDDGLILQDNVHGARAAFVDNWPNRARFWFPNVDHPSDKATVRFRVHAPSRWRVVANGSLVAGPDPTPADAPGPPAAERNTWVWEVGVPISTYNMVVGAADMAVRTVGLAACGEAPASRRDDGCVEVTYWVFPEDVGRAEPSFRRAAQIVDYFTRTVGPYPFEKLANVQSSTRFGGMENASAIFYGEGGIAAGRNIESTVSHEIAHQWFGDAVTERDWHHLWLSEGFATYFGALFFEHADGTAAFRERMEASRRRYLTGDVTDRPIVDPAVHDLFALLNDNNYPKGGWVLHMLRGILGDETFFRGIRTYYARYHGGTALTEDLQQAMEDVSGRELDWFFHQWIYEPGYPVFEVEQRWIPNGQRGTAEITLRQVQDPAWPRFRMPVELALVAGSDTVTSTVEVDGTDDVFRFEDLRAPPRVQIDPNGWILKGDTRYRGR